MIEDGVDGVRKSVAWIVANHPDARGEIKRVFAGGDHVILHSHWHGLTDDAAGEAVIDIFRLESGKVVVEFAEIATALPQGQRHLRAHNRDESA